MQKLLLIAALLGTSITAPLSPAAAKGAPPAPTPVDCQLDVSGRMQCAYTTQAECLTAARAKRKTNRTVQGCYLSTADPDWWHYGLWYLEYYP